LLSTGTRRDPESATGNFKLHAPVLVPMGEICGMFFDSARVAVDRAEATNVAELGERLEPVASVVPPHILESLAMEDRWVGVGGCVLGRSDQVAGSRSIVEVVLGGCHRAHRHPARGSLAVSG